MEKRGISMIKRKLGQVTIYVIIAIVLVVGIVLFFVLRNNLLGTEAIPQEVKEVYDYYQGCIRLETENAIQLAGSQGGRIDVADYVPGSDYAPFSSQLNFLGFPVPYWYYISGNGVIKEQVPSKSDIERELAVFIEEGLSECNFENFVIRGFVIERDEAEVNVIINENTVDVNVHSPLSVQREDKGHTKSTFAETVDTKLGKFYDLALEIYSKEKRDSFLEYYAADVLYLNAPVDGVEIQCGPLLWNTPGVMNDIRAGLEQNFATIKFRGNYYSLSNKTKEYFVVDHDVDEAVNVMYSKQWPTKIEINGEGVDEVVMMAEPVGTQEGMGAMGFCYVPYHFVYDVSFPALIQIYDENEMFQFPVVVVIDNNVPRQALVSELPYEDTSEEDICSKKTEEVEINLYDVNLNEVNGNITFECFDQRCRLGETTDGTLRSLAPACLNGYVSVRAEGYTDKKELFSTNKDKFIDVILDREYELNVSALMDGSKLDKTTIVSFMRTDGVSYTLAFPQQKTITLSEGNYEVSAHVYGNSSITIPASSKTECVDVPKEGLLGLFGSTKEKCFDINMPETKIETALIGGGKTSTYILESDLRKKELIIRVQSLPPPRSIDQLANNFELFEGRRIDLEFR